MLHTMSQATQRTMKAIALDHFGDRSVSLTGGTSMKGDELQVQAIERLQPRAQSCHAGPGQFLESGCFGNTVYLAQIGRTPRTLNPKPGLISGN
jgi:hypothetical protein